MGGFVRRGLGAPANAGDQGNEAEGTMKSNYSPEW